MKKLVLAFSLLFLVGCGQASKPEDLKKITELQAIIDTEENKETIFEQKDNCSKYIQDAKKRYDTFDASTYGQPKDFFQTYLGTYFSKKQGSCISFVYAYVRIPNSGEETHSVDVYDELTGRNLPNILITDFDTKQIEDAKDRYDIVR